MFFIYNGNFGNASVHAKAYGTWVHRWSRELKSLYFVVISIMDDIILYGLVFIIMVIFNNNIIVLDFLVN